MNELQSKPKKISERSNRVGSALQTIDLSLQLNTVYSEVLKERVLDPASQTTLDQKETLRFERILSNDEAYMILAIVWKESSFITDEALSAAGLDRKLDGELSVYRIAIRLSADASQLAAINSRVRNICLAAQHFGLIDRIPQAQTRAPLRATKALNELMLAVSDRMIEIISKWKGYFMPSERR